MKNKNSSLIYQIAILALFGALIAIFTFVLGYIQIGVVSFTLVHIIVAIGAMLLGKRYGAILGLIWGVFSLIRSFSGAAGDYTFMYPWVSILPRIIIGWFYAYAYEIFMHLFKKRSLASAILSGVIVTILHTALVYIVYLPTYCWVYGFKIGDVLTMPIAGNEYTLPIYLLCLGIFGFNCLFESISCAIVCGITIPILSKTSIVKKYLNYIKTQPTLNENKGE